MIVSGDPLRCNRPHSFGHLDSFLPHICPRCTTLLHYDAWHQVYWKLTWHVFCNWFFSFSTGVARMGRKWGTIFCPKTQEEPRTEDWRTRLSCSFTCFPSSYLLRSIAFSLCDKCVCVLKSVDVVTILYEDNHKHELYGQRDYTNHSQRPTSFMVLCWFNISPVSPRV